MNMLEDWRAWHADRMDQVQPILSCLKCFEDSEQMEDILCAECDVTLGEDPKFYLYQQVHGSKALHLGTRQTWQKLNKHFPGHKRLLLRWWMTLLRCALTVRRTD